LASFLIGVTFAYAFGPHVIYTADNQMAGFINVTSHTVCPWLAWTDLRVMIVAFCRLPHFRTLSWRQQERKPVRIDLASIYIYFAPALLLLGVYMDRV